MRVCIVGDMSAGHVPRRAELIRRLGHDVVAVTSSPSGIGGERVVLRSPGFTGYINWIRRYYRAIRDEPADLVHVHYALGMGAWLALAAGRRPLIVTVMGADVLDGEQIRLASSARALRQLLLRRADLVTSKSDYLTAVLRRLGVRPEQILKMMWGIDTQRFHAVNTESLRRQLGVAVTDRVVFSPRAMQPLYNIHLLVEAMPRVLMRMADVKLVLSEFGADVDYRSALMAQIDRLGLTSAVRVVGPIPHEHMAQFYSLADVAIGIPSSDGLPQSLFEAAACGTPSILSNLGRYREFVRDDEEAVFVDLTAEAVAAGICRMLTDDSLRSRVIENGAKVATWADVDVQLKLLDSAYRTLAERCMGKRMSWFARLQAGLLLAIFFIADCIGALRLRFGTWPRGKARFRPLRGAETHQK